MAANSWKTYKTAVDSINKFRHNYSLSNLWPIPLDEIINFIAFLSYTGLSSSTICTYISGISYAHKIQGLTDATNSFLVIKMLEGIRRKGRRFTDIRAPITLGLLHKLIRALPMICSSNYEARLFASAFSLLFFALLRVGEITTDSKSVLGCHTIYFENVSFLEEELYLKILSSKADQRKNSITLVLPPQNTEICPVKLLREYLNVRFPARLCPLFLHFDGSVLTRYQFNSVLQKALKFCNVSDHVRSHSFRIGGASELARIGVSDNDIKNWCRWSSQAYLSYIRLNFGVNTGV